MPIQRAFMALVRVEQDTIDLRREFIRYLLGVANISSEEVGTREHVRKAFEEYVDLVERGQTQQTQAQEKEQLSLSESDSEKRH